MERLEFYPKGESLNGKNYIFFAAHPADREQYFDLLRQEIRSIEDNCVFWYDTRPEDPWEDIMQVDIARMQLILFPVTTALLQEDNGAISRVLPFAIAHNLTVLPILMEPGLESMYQQVFGDRQYLDKVTMDPTAIPYREKLRRFIQDHLVSKEMAEKIRQAFDAYIFLSYRKKDRALAAKLMQLIHEIPQMRDVAIWYDEFLIPGENFNDNIAEALDRCDLFAMAVTPNLVNEDNYVLSTEYPKAVEAAKPILAVQMENTDTEIFHKCFEGLCGTVDAYNYDVLSGALFGNLRHITLAQNNDPLHNYLVGLAYLHGIDVEMDHKRALKLITDSANKDCPEAMERLAVLYFDGTAVKRDFDIALQWREKAVQWWRKKCRESDDVANRFYLADMLAQMGSQLLERELVKQAIKAYREAVDRYAACEQELGVHVIEKRLDALELLACACSNDNDFAGAKTAIFCVVEALSHMPVEDMDPAKRDMLARLYADAGFAEENSGNMEEAQRLYRKSLEVASDTSQGEDAKAYAQLGLGKLYLEQGKCLQAQICLSETIRICRERLQTENTVAHWESIIKAKLLLSDVYCLDNKFKEARAVLQDALNISQEIAQKTGMIAMRCNVAKCYSFLGTLYSTWGKRNRAVDFHRESCHIFEELAEQTNTDLYRQYIASTYVSLAEVYGDLKQWEKADAFYQAAEESFAKLENPIQRDKSLAITYGKHSQIHFETNDLRQGKRCLNEAKSLAVKLLEMGDFPEMCYLLSNVYKALSELYRCWNNPDSAVDCMEKSLEIAQALPVSSENNAHMAECCRVLSAIYSNTGKMEQANAYYQQAKKYEKEGMQERE